MGDLQSGRHNDMASLEERAPLVSKGRHQQ
jgi:hypothetical protein